MPTDDNNARSDLRICMRLSRKIKVLQSACITPVSFSDIGVTLSVSFRPEACRLVDAYLRTFETVYRILLLPAFGERLGRYFGGQFDGQPDKAFLVQLQLCMAIGSVFVEGGRSWREYQERWIREGECWLSIFPPANLAGLQTMCLLHLAKDVCGFGGAGGELTYHSARVLLQKARDLGLHRYPDASVPNHEAELRLRLCATILEFVVQSSLDTGLPPGINLDEFRTMPPGNYDDDQLSHPMGRRSLGTFTQTTVLLELHRSFPVRLAIAQYLADSSSNTEASTVQAGPSIEDLIDRLRRASGELTNALRIPYFPDGHTRTTVPDFQRKMAEMLVHRFFLALNLNLRNSPMMVMPETRRFCSEAASRIWRDVVSGMDNEREIGGLYYGVLAAHNPQMDDFASLLSRGSGATYHATAMVAALTVMVDIREQMEQQKPSAEVKTPEFLDWVNSAVAWTFRRLQVASVDTGPYFQLYLLCSAALEEMKALQRVVVKKWAGQSQRQNGTFVSQAEMKAGRNEAGKLVEDGLRNNLKLVADLLAGLLRRIVDEPNGNGNVTGRDQVRRQSNGDVAAAAAWQRRNSAYERNPRAELERIAELEEEQVSFFFFAACDFWVGIGFVGAVLPAFPNYAPPHYGPISLTDVYHFPQIKPFNSLFDLRNYSVLQVPEVSVHEYVDPRGSGPRRRSLQQ